MTDLDTAATALSAAQTFCANAGSFSSPLAQKIAVNSKTSSDMHLIQLHFIATDVLTSKLMPCFHHFQLHGGKYSVTRHLHFRSLQYDLSLNVHQLLYASGIRAHLHSSILRSATAWPTRSSIIWYMSTTILEFRIAYMDALHTMMMMRHSIDWWSSLWLMRATLFASGRSVLGPPSNLN
jgi:hypothetical protein